MANIVISGDSSGSVTLSAPAVSGNTVLTLPTVSGTIVTTAGATALTTSGNLTFTGTGNRILGDFSNATTASRVMFQSSTTNGNTVIDVIPNGTATTTSFILNTDSAITNGSFAQVLGANNEISFRSGIRGTGSYQPMTFYTGGSERLRIDTSGNVGIGTSSPICPLTIISSSSITIGNPSVVLQGESNRERIAIYSAGAGTGTSVFLTASARGTIASPTAVLTGDTLGYYQFGGYDSVGYLRSAWIQGLAAENYSATNRGSHLTFNTTPIASTTIAERMRITSSGNLLVGTTSALGGRLDVVSTGTDQINIRDTGSTAGRRWRFTTDSNNTVYVINQDTNGVYIGNGGTSWIALSDERHKDIIEPITNAAEKVSTLRAVIGKYKKDEQGTRRSFLIAQDVQAVLPEAVFTTDPKQLGLSYTDTIPLLVAAIQELNAKVTALEAQLGAK